MIAFAHPLALLALPLALTPFLRRWLASAPVPRLDLRTGGEAPWTDRLLKAVGVVGITALILGLAKPHLPGGTRPHQGHGANLVLLIDRSFSMDDSFAGRAPNGDEESKSAAARRLLFEFIEKRPDDRIGVAGFSTAPMQVLALTQSRSAIAAAIAALGERGLSQTDVGRGLAMAMDMFDEAAAPDSRAVVMVSDGAGVIARETQEALQALARRNGVRLYWLYLRTAGAKGIFEIPRPGEADTPQLRPERHLHIFLQRLGVPYRAFEADSPEAVDEAIQAIGDLESRPILTLRPLPRRDLAWIFYGLAALMAGVLAAARRLERAYAPRSSAPTEIRP
ncbi:vWA domain-containing protein [Neomegalonema sp.]|uniref:vWA domain-containing protein n=1 Tax=Neomegalonema sp. TaxID=2039713 RepID=UPI002606FBE9|nr:vWA domain-containing protein [Neomegalonema sp.]MDD2869760.1 VWA domain-containing protein [Neomegalonema sp.]